MGRILHRNFGLRFHAYYGLWDTRFFDAADVQGMLEMNQQIDCIASHMITLDLPYNSKTFDINAISFVRDPVERVLSLYFHSLRMAKEVGAEASNVGIDNFFEKVLSEQRERRFIDAQYRFLTHGIEGDDKLSQIRDLIRSKKILIAPLERFNETCLLLETRFPDYFKNTSYTSRKMLSPRNQEVTELVRSKILESNRMDSDLYKMVAQEFEKNCNDELGGAAKMQVLMNDFKQRGIKLAKIEKMENMRNAVINFFSDKVGRILR